MPKTLNGIGNLLMLIGLTTITIAGIWGIFEQGWSPWQITAALGSIIFGLGLITVFIAYAAKNSKAD